MTRKRGSSGMFMSSLNPDLKRSSRTTGISVPHLSRWTLRFRSNRLKLTEVSTFLGDTYNISPGVNGDEARSPGKKDVSLRGVKNVIASKGGCSGQSAQIRLNPY